VAPNPTRDATILAYALPRAGNVSLVVLDASGRAVRTLASGPLPAGPHTARWDLRNDAGRTVRSGVYFLRLALDDETRTVRTIVAH
jgi:flagellar hook assembly protein FlgD